MLKNLKAVLVLSVFITLFISCTKDVEPVIPTEPDPIETPIPDDETVAPEDEPNGSDDEDVSQGEEDVSQEEEEEPGSTDKEPALPGEQPGTEKPEDNPAGQSTNAVEVGTGSGDLTIDGNDAKIKGKNLITVKAGTYGYIKVSNIHGTVNAPVFIKNGGQVTIKGGLETNNITNVTIAGDHVPGVTYGFNFHDVSYRAVTLAGKMSGVTLKSMSFKNVRDYVIYADLSNLRHTGSADTRVEGFKILNSKFDNAAGIEFRGNFSSGQDNGLVKNLEIAHNTIINNDGGNFAYFNNVQDYDIHHNVGDNINPTQNNHNAMFHMIGNGKFHHNKFTNYQGNMIRAWVFSRGSSPATIEIHNNIAHNTRKYSAFEIQGFDRYIVPGKSTVVNAKVYNNTAGKLNTSKDWDGVMLDLYNFGGTLEYYNNLGFELHQGKPITDMINNMSSTRIIKNTNNKYFNTASEAVSNNLASKHAGVGAN